MIKYIYASALAVMLSCTSPERATSVLETDGYTNIELTGYRAFGCSDSDGTCTGFKAMKNGHHVEGAVGCGRVAGCTKGCTIRVD